MLPKGAKGFYRLLRKYFRVWLKMTANSFVVALASRFSAVFFVLGKVIRFIFFIAFLLVIFSRTQLLGGYNLVQVVFFFLTFNLVSIISQLFLREIYRFRSLIVRGDFDLVLVKPINPLFRVLAGGADVLDLITLPPLVAILAYTATKLGVAITAVNLTLYLLLIISGLIIAVAFHALVAAVGVLTTEVDNTIMLYRDLENMGRIPVDLYRQPIRAFLTFLVPVAVMVTFPAKVLMGLLSPLWVVFSFALAAVFLWGTLRFWRFSLTRYSSASS